MNGWQLAAVAFLAGLIAGMLLLHELQVWARARRRGGTLEYTLYADGTTMFTTTSSGHTRSGTASNPPGEAT